MKINSNTPFPSNIPSKKMPVKGKVNKKRLFYIFFSTFIAFFAVLLILATWISPSINIPPLNNEQQNPANGSNTISSDDFKGHMDPRLKSLEENEGMTASSRPSAGTSSQNIQQNSEAANAYIDKDQNNVDTPQRSDVNNNYDAQNNATNYDNKDSDSYNQDNNQNPNQQQDKDIDTPNPVNKQDSAPDLKDKVKAQRPSSMTKVVVGSYSDPSTARRASQALSNSNLNVTPFIKEKNGVYSLQVGSFSNQQKAQNLANELKKRNLDPKVIQDDNQSD